MVEMNSFPSHSLSLRVPLESSPATDFHRHATHDASNAAQSQGDERQRACAQDAAAAVVRIRSTECLFKAPFCQLAKNY